MTRPQKESDMKREHRVTIRLTDTEFSIIENTAEQADMSISEYMRKQIMEGQVNTKFEIVADVKEIKKLTDSRQGVQAACEAKAAETD